MPVSDEDRAVMLPSGRQPLFSNRMAWAVTHLAQAGLLDRPARGVTQITDRGSEVLTRYPDRVDMKVLGQFSEYEEFRARTKQREGQSPLDTVKNSGISREDLSPSDSLMHVTSLNLTYPGILDHFGKHKVSGRTDSRAFLGWFLENYFRLEQLRVEDSICDGPDDKGIDGIYVDSTLEVIYVFQAKLMQKDSRTLGDSALREFTDTLGQFNSPQSVKALADSTSNVELKNLILDEDLAAKIETGYEVRGIFLTNAALDHNGNSFLSTNGQITVYDRARLKNDWLPIGDTEPVEKEIAFHLDGLGHIEYKTENATVYVVSLRATELVQMAGIESQALFEWNVRQSLGRTKVNRAIAESVASPAEHKNSLPQRANGLGN
jgi:restriction endonuclease Mrr